MNREPKFYGPEKFAKVITNLTKDNYYEHPECYYEFIRRALTVINFITSIKNHILDFNINREFLEKFGNLKGDVDIEDFLRNLFFYAKNEKVRNLVKSFVMSYYDLANYVEDMDGRHLNFKDKSYINSKYNEVLLLIFDLCSSFVGVAKAEEKGDLKE